MIGLFWMEIQERFFYVQFILTHKLCQINGPLIYTHCLLLILFHLIGQGDDCLIILACNISNFLCILFKHLKADIERLSLKKIELLISEMLAILSNKIKVVRISFIDEFDSLVLRQLLDGAEEPILKKFVGISHQKDD